MGVMFIYFAVMACRVYTLVYLAVGACCYVYLYQYLNSVHGLSSLIFGRNTFTVGGVSMTSPGSIYTEGYNLCCYAGFETARGVRWLVGILSQVNHKGLHHG